MTEFDFTTQVTKTLQINRKEQNQNAETLSRLLDSRFSANETLKNINIELLVSVGGSTSRLRSTSSERSEVALSSVLVARKLNLAKERAKKTKHCIQGALSKQEILRKLKVSLIAGDLAGALQQSVEFSSLREISIQNFIPSQNSFENELSVIKNDVESILNKKIELILNDATFSEGDFFFNYIEIASKIGGAEKVVQYLSKYTQIHVWKNYENIITVCEGPEDIFRRCFLNSITCLFDNTLEILDKKCRSLTSILYENLVSEYVLLCHEECSKVLQKILMMYLNRRKFDRDVLQAEIMERSCALPAHDIDIFLEELSGLCAQYEQYRRIYCSKITEICDNTIFRLNPDKLYENKLKDFEKIYEIYCSLEFLYIKKSIYIAFNVEEYGNFLTSSIVDDVLYISERSIKRAIQTVSYECVSSVLDSVNSAFTCHVFPELSGRITRQASCIKTDQLVDAIEFHHVSAGNTQAKLEFHAFIRSLNDIDAMSEVILKLDELLISGEMHGKIKEEEYILNCTRNLKESSLQFKNLCSKMVDVVSNAFVDIFGTCLQILTATSYELAHDKYEDNHNNWIGQIIVVFQKITENLVPIMSSSNFSKVVHQILEDLSRRIEMIVMTRLRFNHLGGLHFEREIRKLVANLTSLMQCQMRDIFSRLNQIGMVLSFETFDEIMDYWGDRSGLLTWRINRSEVKRILSLRVDFRLDSIEALQL